MKDIIEHVTLVFWRDLQHECKQYKLDITNTLSFLWAGSHKGNKIFEKKKKPTILEIWMHIPR